MFWATDCPADVRGLLFPFLDKRGSDGITAGYGLSLTQDTALDAALSEAAFRARDLWAPSRGTDYDTWVCTLVGRLLSDCYEVPVVATSSKRKTSGDSRPSPMLAAGLRGQDEFLRLCLPMARLRPEFAELLFPAVIDDLTRFTEPRSRKIIRYALFE